jgi:3-hydroxyacyl-[acyl-carrier-protein] dehydratase
MSSAPFIAKWQAGPLSAGVFEARLVLDDQCMFAGHYPGAPILPGTYLIEALFQAAYNGLGGPARLEEIVACRFYSPLFPGDAVAARFTLKDVGAGRVIVEATAIGRTKAAELTMVVARPDAHPMGSDSAASVATWTPDSPHARTLDAPFVHRALPHRPPALLVDSAVVFEPPGASPALLAYRVLAPSEACNTRLAESFCQACGLLRAATGPASEPDDDTKVPVVAKLAGLRFTGDVAPGDLLEHRVQLVVRTGEGAVFSGQTVVAGRAVLQVARVVAARAEIQHGPGA